MTQIFDDDGSGEKKSDDGSGDGKKSDDGSSNNDDDDYTPNDDPQSTWFKVFKLLATRLLYIGVKRSCERSVKRKWKFLKFINISQAKKLQLLAKAKGKEHQTFVEYTCLGKASRDFSQTYTSFLTWCFFGSLTCISFVWGVVIHEFKKEMSAKNALYMHRLDEITKVAKQNQEDLQKIVALLVSKK
ncbi:hypothetical protein AtEden1_Chr4g0313971 [Arabidopsis thaliana]